MTNERPYTRIDEQNRMGLEKFHAPRALRQFEHLAPEQRREAIKGASFRNEGAHLGEQEVTRATLLRMLDRIEGIRTPEQQRLLDGLMDQREQAGSVWTDKFFVKGTPKQAEIITRAGKWLDSLSADVLQGLLEVCPDSAQLVVVPGGITAPELLQAIDRKKTVPGQKNGKIWSPELWNGVKAEGWKFGITSTKEDLEFDPTIYWFNPDAPENERQLRTNEQMVAEYERRFLEKNLGIMPQYGYVPSAANRLAEGKVMDKQFWTAFNRPQGAAFLPNAGWGDFHVNLGIVGPGTRDVLRCRPWVEGEM